MAASNTAKLALIAALLGFGKAYNFLGSQPPSLALPPTPDGDVILRGNFSATRGVSSAGDFILNADCDEFGASIAAPQLAGSAVIRKPYSRIGLRALISNPLSSGSSEWRFFMLIYVKSQGGFAVADLQLPVLTTSPRIIDTGLISVAQALEYEAGIVTLIPGADILTLGEVYIIGAAGPQVLTGHVEAYGEV